MKPETINFISNWIKHLTEGEMVIGTAFIFAVLGYIIFFTKVLFITKEKGVMRKYVIDGIIFVTIIYLLTIAF